MEKILVMDEHNYDDNLEEILRISVRGIIFVNGKLMMVENSFGEVKLPGGGMELGEEDYQVLLREVKEETGYDVIPESIKPFGEIEEKRLSVHEPMIWHQINRLYVCDVYPEQGQCTYTDVEKKHGFHLVFYTIEEALEKNRRMLEKEGRQAWNQREYNTLLLIKDAGGHRDDHR
ncbi:MAG: NUDIX domain-containing protein [Acetatifactor sp.]|nr:NUDIX domain-containing protein [Acetatifactor sp.]